MPVPNPAPKVTEPVVVQPTEPPLGTALPGTPGHAAFIGPTAFTREWVVSPSGNDAADGSSSAPFKTIGRAVAAVGPGERITVKAGTYAERIWVAGNARAGTATAKISLHGEGNPKIVPGSPESVMIQIERPHWVLDGLDIDASGQSHIGVGFMGSTEGSALLDSEVHHGTHGYGVGTFAGAQGVTLQGNHIHHFTRVNDDSHGVLVQPTSKNITIRRNRIHDNSGDSVQCIGPEDFGALAPADGLVIEDNDLYSNRENAVDIKTCKNVVVRNNKMHGFLAALPGGCAVVVHYSASNILIEGNDIYEAGKGIALGGVRAGPPPSGVVIRRNLIRQLTKGDQLEGVGIRIETSTGTQVINNTLAKISGTALAVGHGSGGPTNQLTVKNNILEAAVGLDVGTQAPGLVVQNNLYPTRATFEVQGVPQTFPLWQAMGYDTQSLQADPPYSEGFAPAVSGVDRGENVGLIFCGPAPDLGAVETGCEG